MSEKEGEEEEDGKAEGWSAVVRREGFINEGSSRRKPPRQVPDYSDNCLPDGGGFLTGSSYSSNYHHSQLASIHHPV